SQSEGRGLGDLHLGCGARRSISSMVDSGKGRNKEKDVAVQIVDHGTLYYNAATTKRIIIHGNGGNDTFDVKGDVKTPLVLDGGEGNDSIEGGHGKDMLLGGPGDDQLKAQDGMDVLIGGTGMDTLK